MNAAKLALVAVVFALGCAGQGAPQQDEVGVASAALTKDFTFTEFADPKGIGGAGTVPTRLFIASQTQYRLVFGHSAPSGIDFAAGDRVVFYSAGVRPTGGYDASITRVRRVDGELRIRTQLDAPGAGCVVTQALTKPYVLVKFRVGLLFKPVVRFSHTTNFEDCEAPPSCDDITCIDGQHCELLEIECITTPCNPIPTCVADKPAVPFCGGIAGIECPGLGTCLDIPLDSCDPNYGGADCGGYCACLATKICVLGTVWDPTPGVCACVAL
jgi:PrcB C-terminal